MMPVIWPFILLWLLAGLSCVQTLEGVPRTRKTHVLLRTITLDEHELLHYNMWYIYTEGIFFGLGAPVQLNIRLQLRTLAFLRS